MENYRAATPKKEKTISISGPKANSRPCGSDRHFVCTQNWYSLGVSSQRNGLRQRYDLLAAVKRLAESWCLGQNTPRSAQQTATCRPDRFFSSPGRFGIDSRSFWGAKTGPNPTDRRKSGTKHHLITDRGGIPLAVKVTGANRHDVTQLLPLVKAIPPITGKRGRPRQRPDYLQGDRAYDSEPHRKDLRKLSIVPVLAKRRTEHGSGLGVYRWVVERTLAWLYQLRRLRVRYERRPDIHEAFLSIGCIIICWNRLSNSFC